MEEMLAYILVIPIICGVVFLFNYLSKKDYEYELTQPDDITRIKKDAVLDNYLLIFNSAIGNPYKNLTLSRSLYKKIKRNFKNPIVIRQLINQILIHLCLPIVNFRINIYNYNGNAAGEYIPSHNAPTINLYVKDTYTAQNVIAIICHECTHHFMYKHNMSYNYNNEFITDALAIYLGLGKYIWDGYGQQKSIVNKQYRFENNDTTVKYSIESSTIGYLDLGQIEYLMKKVRKLKLKAFCHSLLNRINFLGKIKKRVCESRIKELGDLKLTFSQNYKIHLEIIQRNNEIIALLCSKQIDKMSTSDAVLVQNCILNINAGTYYSDAEHLKNSVSKCNDRKKDLKLYIKKLSEQSAKLTLINTKLAKYL